MVKKASPPSPKFKDFFFAYLIGGFICVMGQLMFEAYYSAGLSENNARMTASLSLVLIAALLTALGVFDDIARIAGAGTLVPITGFANAVVSPAIEYKAEGQITGLGAKMFTVAGPVLVFGITASAVYGLIYWLCNLL